MKELFLFFTLLICSRAYSAHYLIEHKGNKMHVTATFKHSELKGLSKNIELYIPETVWGTNFFKQITNINTNGIYDPKNKTISLKTGKDLHIKYDVMSISILKLAENFANSYDHFISGEKFYMLGLGLFIHPDNFDGPITVKVKSNVKKIAYNTFPYFHKDNTITCHISDLNQLAIVGSNHLKYISKCNTDIIIWSGDTLLQHEFEKTALPAFNQHEEFWHEEFWQETLKRKLAIIFPAPINIAYNRIGGTLLDNKTILFFVASKKAQSPELTFVFKHEHLHFWFGKLLQGPKWFIEGFTDYYVEKIDLHYNKDLKHFVDTYNIKAREYFSSPASKWSDKGIDKYFFEVASVQRIPYLKGYLIAGQIDSIIDLDTALKNMVALCKKDKKYCEFTAKNLFRSCGRISYKKKKIIKCLINDFNNSSLRENLVPNTFLTYKKQQIYNFSIDALKVWDNHYIKGKELNRITNKFNAKKKYKVLATDFDFLTGKNELTIQNRNTEEKIQSPPITSTISIPYYKFY